MSELAKLVGASSPEDAAQIAPLSAKDWGELELWMQRQPFDRVRPFLDQASDSEREMLLRIADNDAKELSLTSEAGRTFMNSIRGVTMLVFLSLRKRNPNLTIEQVSALSLPEIERFGSEISKRNDLGNEGN